MRARGVDEIREEYGDLLNSPGIDALSNLYRQGPPPLGNPRPLTEQEIQEGSDGLSEADLLTNAREQRGDLKNLVEHIFPND